jgi:arylsulfatase B
MGTNEPDYDADNPILRASQPVDEREHLTDALAREADSFIDRHQYEPFLLLLAYNAVHSPMQGADAYMERFRHIDDVQRRIFAAMLSHLDDSVGRVLKKLRGANLEENTLVVFLSDNGGPTRELTSRNDPLRGGKGELYEGGIRVPFVMQWPARLKSGQVEEQPVISLDLAATMLAAAEIKGSTQDPLDGIDLLTYLNGQWPMPDRPLYWRVGAKAAVRQGKWKAVRERRGPWELYDLATDMGQREIEITEQNDRLQQLTRTWEEMNSRMAEPLWGPRVRPARQRADR